jgi:hypothetical protein
MAIVNDMGDPCAPWLAHVNLANKRDYRVKLPLGSGAGNGVGDCCADWAGCWDWSACTVEESGGGVVVRLWWASFLPVGGGGAAVAVPSADWVSPSGSAAEASAAGALLAGRLLFLAFACFDFDPGCWGDG